jgi:hypothetical protein
MSLLRFFAMNTSPLPRSHTMLLPCDLSALSLIWFNTLIFVAEQNRSKVHGTLLPHCKYLPRYLIDSLYPIPSYAINLLSHGFVTVLCCAVLLLSFRSHFFLLLLEFTISYLISGFHWILLVFFVLFWLCHHYYILSLLTLFCALPWCLYYFALKPDLCILRSTFSVVALVVTMSDACRTAICQNHQFVCL